MAQKWYRTPRHPKMYPHTKFGIPTSKNLGDMHWTRSGTYRLTDGQTDGRTVQLLYASQCSFWGIKIIFSYTLLSCGLTEEAGRSGSKLFVMKFMLLHNMVECESDSDLYSIAKNSV